MGKKDTDRKDTGGRDPDKPGPVGRAPADGEAHARRQAVIDGMLADALRPPAATILPSRQVLAPDIQGAIEALLAKAAAQRSRCLTYDDLEEALPARDVSAEDLEAIFWILAEHGIAVEDDEG